MIMCGGLSKSRWGWKFDDGESSTRVTRRRRSPKKQPH
jgi:hypothetical protein